VAAVAAVAEQVTVGDPSDPANHVGPLVTARQKQRVQEYIQSGIDEGARVVVGGLGAPEGLESGNYVRPTVFADVDNSMRIAQEEIFGPVLVIIPFDDEDDSPYGLSGGVWTSDQERGLAVARRIRTGTFSVNNAMHQFDAPFGGFKASGVGREFGTAGLGQYLELKSVSI
jgi:acyl-CoA reductase-like NAD-dependent aldehyde dehydrogenase